MKLNQIIGTFGLVVAFAACSKRDAAAPAAPAEQATAEAKKKVYQPILAASHYALEGDINCNGLADRDTVEFNVVLASSDAEKVVVPSRMYESSGKQAADEHVDSVTWLETEYDVEKIENGQMTIRSIALRYVTQNVDGTIEKTDIGLKEEVVSERGFRVNKDGTVSISNPDLKTNGCTFGTQYITLKKL